MELLRLEKAPRSSTFNQIPPRATCAQFLDRDSATSLGSLFQCLTTLFHEKIFPGIQDNNNTSLLPNKPCHPCPGLESKGSTAGTVDWGWEQLRAKPWRISALALCRMECVGLTPFPRCPQGPWGAPATQDWDLPVAHLKETEAPMPKHLQEPRSPWPACSPSGIPKSDLKSHSLGRVWSFVLRVQGKTAQTFLTLQPAPSSAGSGAGRLLDGLNHFKSCFCCTWWAHPKFTTHISSSW